MIIKRGNKLFSVESIRRIFTINMISNRIHVCSRMKQVVEIPERSKSRFHPHFEVVEVESAPDGLCPRFKKFSVAEALPHCLEGIFDFDPKTLIIQVPIYDLESEYNIEYEFLAEDIQQLIGGHVDKEQERELELAFDVVWEGNYMAVFNFPCEYPREKIRDEIRVILPVDRILTKEDLEDINSKIRSLLSSIYDSAEKHILYLVEEYTKENIRGRILLEHGFEDLVITLYLTFSADYSREIPDDEYFSDLRNLLENYEYSKLITRGTGRIAEGYREIISKYYEGPGGVKRLSNRKGRIVEKILRLVDPFLREISEEEADTIRISLEELRERAGFCRSSFEEAIKLAFERWPEEGVTLNEIKKGIEILKEKKYVYWSEGSRAVEVMEEYIKERRLD